MDLTLYESAITLYDRPRAEIVNMSVKSVNGDEVEMDVELEVDNPNEEALHLVDIDFMFEDVHSSSDMAEGSSNVAERRVIVKNVRRSCIVQPRTSEIIRVPLQLLYKDIKSEKNPQSRVGHAGRIIPFTVRANLNCWETLRGVFQITIARMKQFLTIVDRKLGGVGLGGKLKSFNPPFGRLNGVHFIEISDSEAKLNAEFRVRNNNPLPIQLVCTNVVLESLEGGKTFLSTKVDNHMSLAANSARRVGLPMIISIKDIVSRHDDVKPGSIVPCVLKMEYWFRENFYGMYKVTGEKQVDIPIPVKPELKVSQVMFQLVPSKADLDTGEVFKPTANMSVILKNPNDFYFNITKFVYDVVDQDGAAIARVSNNIDKDHPLVVDAQGEAVVNLHLVEMQPSFGSALWKVFAEDYSNYQVHSLLEAECVKFGKLVFR